MIWVDDEIKITVEFKYIKIEDFYFANLNEKTVEKIEGFVFMFLSNGSKQED